MAKTNADYQREHRQRRARRLSGLEQANASLRAEVATLSTALENANAEIERLSTLACKHPPSAVDGGACRACGADIW